MMNKNNPLVWLNDEFISASEALIPAESKGLMYGAGCFETLRSRNGKFMHLNLHAERFFKGLNYLGISTSEFPELEYLKKVILLLLEKNGLLQKDAVVRMQASLIGGRGYQAGKNQGFHLLISAYPAGMLKKEYGLYRTSIRVVPSECRPSDLKLSNTLHYMQAWREAERAGDDDALMLTVDGKIAETAVANLFWKKRDMIYTPSPDNDILPGLMRAIVMKLLDRSGKFGVREESAGPEALNKAELIWVTNSVREIQPVTRIGDTAYPFESSFYEFLYEAFKSYKKTNLA